MAGLSDGIGTIVVRYVCRHGAHAKAQLDADISRAIGRHDWDAAHMLHRVNLRFRRLQMTGHFDDRRDLATRH